MNTVNVSGQENAERGNRYVCISPEGVQCRTQTKTQILSKFPHHNLKNIRNLVHKYILQEYKHSNYALYEIIPLSDLKYKIPEITAFQRPALSHH